MNSLYVDIVYLLSGGDHNLCLKDLRQEVVEKLDSALKKDQTAWKQICLSFGIGISSGFNEIFKTFPNTPLEKFLVVLKALRLDGLIDLLKEKKPKVGRSLQLALRPQEIEKLRNPDDRPISHAS